jgi:hypothetical protein
MNQPLNPAFKKFEEIGRNHIPSPDVAETIAQLKPQVEDSEILPGIRPIWATELSQMDIPPPSWIVDQFVSDSGISLLSSKPGTFKTMLAIEIAKCVAQGEPLFGVFETKQTKVLIIDEESGEGRLKKRQAALGADEADIASISFPGVKMEQKYAEAITRYCKANGIGLVIFDSLTRLHTAQENASQEMSEVLSHFHLITKAGIAVLIIHHDTKGGYAKPDSSNTLRGSSDILAIADVHIVLHMPRNSKNKLTVMQLKNRDDELIDDFELVAKSNDDKTRLRFEYAGEAPKRIGKPERTDAAILGLLANGEPQFQEQIIGALKGTEGTGGEKMVADRLKILLDADVLTFTLGPNGQHLYELLQGQTNE